ncbi:MAG: hypothetical protein VSS75_003230 [Candidatus Parabeggiatoa sp.]|nr:hypothetical protein [Candidatus Parabeggiatoa sp.]
MTNIVQKKLKINIPLGCSEFRAWWQALLASVLLNFSIPVKTELKA